MMDNLYPFSALVGQNRLRLALELCAIDPAIGGVLVRGEKGTAKSTAVRALAPLLPEVDGRRPRLVELPVGATEDRVVGSLDLRRVLQEGESAYQPGLLVDAHGGVLYVDEINLLPDHLVDVLLDAAAMGRLHVERDGISHTEPARFLLVGTMNPEEGELRPQLLDRFGLTVDVRAAGTVDERVEIVRRRLAFDADRQAFRESWADGETQVAERLAAARARLDAVALPDAELRRIASISLAFDVEGMRADLVMGRCALAHAARRAAPAVAEEDVRVAAELALPHRRRRDPFDAPGMDPEQLDDAMERAREELDGPRSDEPSEPEARSDPKAEPPEGTDPEGGPASEDDRQARADAPLAPAGARVRTRHLEIPGVGEGAAGRRSRAVSRRGHVVRPTPAPHRGLHLPATVVAALGRGARPYRGRIALTAADLRGNHREGREGNLVVFVVDTSGSMAARDRLAAVRGAIESLLRDAYQRRDKVAVVTLRGTAAEIAVPATSSIDAVVRRLGRVRTGGRTPLAEGLLTAREVIRREELRDPTRRALLVALTDGRATSGPDALGRALRAAALVAADDTAAVVLDCESGHVRLGLAADLAESMGRPCIRLEELSAEAVAGVVRTA